MFGLQPDTPLVSPAAEGRLKECRPDKMPTRILILCTGNSARSQMAEGLMKSFDANLDVHSAGTRPASRVHPGAVEAMREIGIDISQQTSKDVVSLLGQHVPYVVTVCDNARERCPIFPGTWKFLHWSLEDPAAVEGTPGERLAVFQRVREQIIANIGREFVQGDITRKRA